MIYGLINFQQYVKLIEGSTAPIEQLPDENSPPCDPMPSLEEESSSLYQPDGGNLLMRLAAKGVSGSGSGIGSDYHQLPNGNLKMRLAVKGATGTGTGSDYHQLPEISRRAPLRPISEGAAFADCFDLDERELLNDRRIKDANSSDSVVINTSSSSKSSYEEDEEDEEDRESGAESSSEDEEFDEDDQKPEIPLLIDHAPTELIINEIGDDHQTQLQQPQHDCRNSKISKISTKKIANF